MDLLKFLNKKYWFLLAFLFIVNSCFPVSTASSPVSENFSPNQSYTLSNVHYGTDNQQTMDIYLPANRSRNSTKILILVHGGGWIFGDKSEFNSGVPQLMAAIPDMAVINANYRLYQNGKNTFPAQEDDMKAIYNYVLQLREKAQLSDKIALYGQSAGAGMVLLQAYKNSETLKPKAVIDWYGPTDLLKLYQENTQNVQSFAKIIGGTPEQVPQNYFQASPVNFVTAFSPPTLILHGGKDNLVLPSQANYLKQKLDEKGVPNQIKIYPNSGHGFQGNDFNDAATLMIDFLKKYF